MKIMSGQDTAPMATVFAVFAQHDGEGLTIPIFAPVQFEVDVEARKGRAVVPGLLEGAGRADQKSW